MIKPTVQMLAAGILVLVAVVVALPIVLAGPGSYPIRNEELRFDVSRKMPPVVPAAAVAAPMVEGAAGQRELNPFSLRQESTVHQVKIGLPPPPPVGLPELPVLPLPAEVRK